MKLKIHIGTTNAQYLMNLRLYILSRCGPCFFCLSGRFASHFLLGGVQHRQPWKLRGFFHLKTMILYLHYFNVPFDLQKCSVQSLQKKNVSIHFLTTARNGPWGKQKSEKDLWNFHYTRPISGFANRPWRCLWVKKMISIPCWSRSVWGRGVYPIHHFQEWSLSQDSIPFLANYKDQTAWAPSMMVKSKGLV